MRIGQRLRHYMNDADRSLQTWMDFDGTGKEVPRCRKCGRPTIPKDGKPPLCYGCDMKEQGRW